MVAEKETSGSLRNKDGLEYVQLKHSDSTSDVYLYGSVVTSYIKDGQEYIAI